MEFSIYIVSENFDVNNIESYEKVEQGLSAGEVRQSLIDRFNQELKYSGIKNINRNFSSYGLSISFNNIKKDIEETLYDRLSDEDISNRMWFFHREIIYIKGE